VYTSQELAAVIKITAKRSNKILKDVFSNCGLNSNTMSALYHGKSIAFDSLAKISDELDCSVDYLLGRTENPQSHKGGVSVTTGDISLSDVGISHEGKLGIINVRNVESTNEQMRVLLNAFNNLDPFKQAKVLVYVDELSKTE